MAPSSAPLTVSCGGRGGGQCNRDNDKVRGSLWEGHPDVGTQGHLPRRGGVRLRPEDEQQLITQGWGQGRGHRAGARNALRDQGIKSSGLRGGRALVKLRGIHFNSSIQRGGRGER